ncbi:MAG: hypothetical protein ABF379_03950 [Akkermansiaceae bacterium]
MAIKIGGCIKLESDPNFPGERSRNRSRFAGLLGAKNYINPNLRSPVINLEKLLVLAIEERQPNSSYRQALRNAEHNNQSNQKKIISLQQVV